MTDTITLTLTRDEIQVILDWGESEQEVYSFMPPEVDVYNRLLALVDPEFGMEPDTAFLETPTCDQQSMRARLMRIHWSDCALHRAPAYEPGPCNCGGLELFDDAEHVPVALLSRPRHPIRRMAPSPSYDCLDPRYDRCRSGGDGAGG